MGMYLFIWLFSLTVVLLLSHWVQIKNFRKGKCVKKSSLSSRSRLAIILAGVGVVSYIIPLRESELISKQQEIEFAMRFDVRQISRWDKIEERKFVDSIYSRAVLDSAEKDYRDYNHWMENNVEVILSKMAEKEKIMLDSLYLPAPKTEIGTAEISFYRESFIWVIDDYNRNLEDYNEIHNKRETLQGVSLTGDLLLAVLLLIAIMLQFNVLFWEDHLDDEPCKPISRGKS